MLNPALIQSSSATFLARRLLTMHYAMRITQYAITLCMLAFACYTSITPTSTTCTPFIFLLVLDHRDRLRGGTTNCGRCGEDGGYSGDSWRCLAFHSANRRDQMVEDQHSSQGHLVELYHPLTLWYISRQCNTL